MNNVLVLYNLGGHYEYIYVKNLTGHYLMNIKCCLIIFTDLPSGMWMIT